MNKRAILETGVEISLKDIPKYNGCLEDLTIGQVIEAVEKKVGFLIEDDSVGYEEDVSITYNCAWNVITYILVT